MPIEAYTVEELESLLSSYRGLETLGIFLSMCLFEEGGGRLADLKIMVGGKIAIRVRSPQRHKSCQSEEIMKEI